MRAAIDERSHGKPKSSATWPSGGAVAGQARGPRADGGPAERAGDRLVPEAVSGHKGRPTLLSNAETWARIRAPGARRRERVRRLGTAREPEHHAAHPLGEAPRVVEVEFGSRLRDVLPESVVGLPTLIGGFHGPGRSGDAGQCARPSTG
ncbi:MAG: hypothetical protein R2731_05515 [Nocardioides sp.]